MAIEQLVYEYKSGESVKNLAAKFGVHRSTVSKHLTRNGVKRHQRGLLPEQIPKAEVMYGNGMTLREVGQFFGVDAETIRQAFIKHRVRVRSR